MVDATRSAPLIGALAARLRPYAVDGICGPLVGGAFLAQALAHELKVRFYYTEREQTVAVGGAVQRDLPAAAGDRRSRSRRNDRGG